MDSEFQEDLRAHMHACKEELEDINSNISKFVRDFIEYDLKVTEQGAKKGLKAKKKKASEKAEPQYVI